MDTSINGNANAQVPAVTTPPAGTGKVLSSEMDDVVLEDGMLEGVGDGGGKSVKVTG